MEIKNTEQLFESFSRTKALIIGDVMIDSYMWAKVQRISPEAPIPIAAVFDKENRMGGAANVAINVQSLGAEPIMCSIIGPDKYGDDFMALMKKRGMKPEGIMRSTERQTTVKTRIISGSQHLLRVDEEQTENLSPQVEERFIKRIKEIMDVEMPSVVIFEDYDKGVITPELIRAIIKECKLQNIPVAVDPKKRNFSYYQKVELFKPNFKELCDGLKTEIAKTDMDSLQRLAGQIIIEYGIENVLITLAEAGVFISDRKEYHHIPAHVRDIADVSGAGDTVIATASLCMAAGLSNRDIACIANMAGGLVCEKTGVVPVNKEKLFEALKREC